MLRNLELDATVTLEGLECMWHPESRKEGDSFVI